MKTKWIVLIICCLFLAAGPLSASAQEEKWPTKPITMILVYAPGGGTDASNKALIEALRKELKVQIIPKYVVGGAGSLGAYELSQAKPDGYTIGNTTLVAMAQAPYTTGVKYKPLEDFEYFGTFIQFTTGYMVRADSPYKTLKDLIEAARKGPETIKFGNYTPGGFMGLTPAYLEKAEKVTFKNVPFPGGAGEAMSALLGGHVDFMGSNPAGIKPYVKSGHVRMLVSGSYERHSDLTVPTLRELGYDFDQISWNALGAPKGIPPYVKKRLDDALAKAVKDPEFIKIMNNLDTPVDYHNGEEYKELITKYYKLYGEILKDGYRF
ncbi:MAG: tripartite tricarboxylate transporter substrate binding protein [Syntrophobacteraceae bacterium]